jgi:glycosyltransferase involved in cell wall biosynthesis
LSDLGHETSCIHRKNFGTDSKGSIVTFHRPRETWSWQRWMRARGFPSAAKHIAEVDDLVFDPALAAHSPAVRNRHKSLWSTRRLFRGNGRALARFDRISTSTEPLASHLRNHFPKANVEVFPNCIPCAWRSLPISPLPTQARTLTYFPGTRGHNADFAMIAGAVRKFLASHPDWHLLVAGPLEFKLGAAQHQVRHLERVDFERYHEIVRRGAINLAPLEDSPFNQCKSALKIMEAGFFGIPSVASAIPDAERFAGDGVEFASSPNEWIEALCRLASRFPYGDLWREQLRSRIVRNASIEREAARWTGWLGLASSEAGN